MSAKSSVKSELIILTSFTNNKYDFNINFQIDAENLEDVDNGIEFCVLYYNQALMHYYTKQFSSALKVLNKLLLSFENLSKVLLSESYLIYASIISVFSYQIKDKSDKNLKLVFIIIKTLGSWYHILKIKFIFQDKTYESFAKLSACLMMQVLLVTYKVI